MKRCLFFAALTLAVPGFAQTLKMEPVANPAGADSVQAAWSVTREGSPLLSWVETSKDDSYSLRYSIRRGAQWSQPRTVVANRKFFRHPAELPEVMTLSDGGFLAHWVEMPMEGSDTEFLYVSASRDGEHWTAPVMAHKDKSPVQHGLASMVSSGNREASVFWLEALKGEDGPVALKRTVISGDGKVIKEESLDSDTCACCPTSVVKTARGLLVAYRDHTPDDIRDIAVIRLENDHWSPSKILNPDKWKINACPINAASASANGDRVAISWYTGAQNMPRVQAMFSSDSGTTFGKPVLVSTGRSFGYTSAALVEGGAIVSWLEQGGDATRVLARYVSDAGVAGPVLQVAVGSQRNLGYPRTVHAGNETWITWRGADSKLQTARLTK